MNFSVILDNFDYLMLGAWQNGALGGLALTLFLSVLTAMFSAVLGLIFGIMLVMGGKFVKTILIIFLGFLRAIPIIMLIFWFYFLLPIVFNVTAPKLTTAIGALSLVGGAYMAHAVAAGLHSIRDGQWSAGLALGFNRWQVLWQLILPQALPRMMPSFVNQWTSLIKDTSLAYIIGVQEFFYIARQVDGSTYTAHSIEIYFFAGIVYLCLCTGLSIFANYFNKHYAANHAIATS